eukprot:3294601-Prymnesium_polylepis.1
MPRGSPKKRPTACSGGLTLRSTFVDQRHPEGTAAALFRSRARAAHHRSASSGEALPSSDDENAK